MDKEAFAQEAKRLRPTLINIAMRHTGSRDEAEDIVQDALLKLWTLCPELHMPVEPLARVLASNMAKDRMRRLRPTLSIDSAATCNNDSEPEPTPDTARITAIMATLPDMQQLILRLRHMEGMTYKEISRLTGTTEEALRKALSRARKTIKDLYTQNS